MPGRGHPRRGIDADPRENTIYLGEQEIAREVTWLEPVEGGVRLATFFVESRVVRGRIRRIDFLRHRVLLELDEEGDNGGN